MQKTHAKGFTLIELMIVVAIIAIIGAIALPSYNNYILRGKRSEGRAALMDAAARQERSYSDNNQYVSLQKAGINTTSENDNYTISITLSNNNQNFTLRATPKSPKFKDPECGYLEIAQTGAKTSQSGNAKDCWGR